MPLVREIEHGEHRNRLLEFLLLGTSSFAKKQRIGPEMYRDISPSLEVINYLRGVEGNSTPIHLIHTGSTYNIADIEYLMPGSFNSTSIYLYPKIQDGDKIYVIVRRNELEPFFMSRIHRLFSNVTVVYLNRRFIILDSSEPKFKNEPQFYSIRNTK